MTAAAAPSSAPAQAALAIEGLRHELGDASRRFRLRVDALHVAPGEMVVLSGASGSGKSTLLEMIGLVRRPQVPGLFRIGAGAEAADAAALFARGDREGLARLRAEKLGFLLQSGGLAPFLTVSENLALAQQAAGRPDRALADAVLEALELGGLGGAWPRALSVGQRQRAALARAIVHRPALVLADEPTAALDPPNKARVAELLSALAEGFGAAVLVATHETHVFDDLPGRRLALRVAGDEHDAEARLETPGMEPRA
ncbi:ABC transporter ATP-binding protein [Rhodovulum sp. DZ06]|uniref:ABC transporter ATP-binding protein n=1 Tax=Rhodovulum sp. DZ06 TaxID=3425126 RepID=UPI003D326C86